MRSRVLRTAGVSITALALSTSLVGMASASDPQVASSGHGVVAAAVAPDAKACFSNTNGATGNLVSSQNFEKANDAYDDEAADDFKLKKTCKVKSIVVPGGYFEEGQGPADNQTVTFYENKKGKPGAKITSQKVNGTDDAGTFTIPLKTVTLEKGTYWVSVVANMNASEKGQWGWAATATAKGSPAVWRNPGGGFGVCEKWTDMQTCIGITGAPDFLFTLKP